MSSRYQEKCPPPFIFLEVKVRFMSSIISINDTIVVWDTKERSGAWRIIKTCCLSQATSKHNTAQIFLSFYQCCVCWSPVVLFKCEICCTHTMARNVTNVSQCESDQMGLIVSDDGLDSFGSQLHIFTHQTMWLDTRKVFSHLWYYCSFLPLPKNICPSKTGNTDVRYVFGW